MRISASRELAASRDAVFAFLADGGNHHKLTDGRLRLLGLSQGSDRELHGLMLLRGPLGLRRQAQTRADSWHEPRSIAGTATLGRRTRVQVMWELEQPRSHSTRVVLRADVDSLAPLDALLLRAGGAAWVRRLFASTLELLARETESGRDPSPALGHAH